MDDTPSTNTLNANDQGLNDNTATNSEVQDNPLDEMIKSKFKLFQDTSTKEDDQKTFDRIMRYCFEETISFLAENLTEEDFENLLKETEGAGTDEEKADVMRKYHSKIENYSFKLNARINGLLNNLLLNGLKKSKQKSEIR